MNYAEALVECGYADDWEEITDFKDSVILLKVKTGIRREECNPFADTLEGRRQADALENWLSTNKNEYWTESVLHIDDGRGRLHQWRLDRIKWCFEQLEKDND